MKTIAGILTGCLLVSFISLWLGGCQKETENPTVTALAVLPIPDNGADIYYGNVNIRTTEMNEIVIAADIQDEVQQLDNISEINFILQRREGEGNPINTQWENVMIKKNQRNLSIIKTDKSAVLNFTLSDENSNGIPQGCYTGYGFSQNNGRWSFDLAFLDGNPTVFGALCGNDYFLKELGGGGGGGNDCPSGGPGSSSCSSSQVVGGLGISEGCTCSVTCDSGYFSCCCDCERCFCILNGSQSPYCSRRPHGIN